MGQDQSKHIIEQIQSSREPFYIRGSNSKHWYGRNVCANPLDMQSHSGIISYEPTELVVKVRAGTSLTDLTQTLSENKQMLAFEPPRFNNKGTIGGAIATGISGCGRPWRAAPRDTLLGATILDGQAKQLTFGGQVMKNVAGYDVSRLMAGAHGTLGILLDVSLKLIPKPIEECSITINISRNDCQQLFKQFANQNLPFTGACYINNELHVRLSGHPDALHSARKQLPESQEEDLIFWDKLRDLKHFSPMDIDAKQQLWRLSVPPATETLSCESNHSILDWAGAQRWIYSDASRQDIRAQVEAIGGHATLFTNKATDNVFHSLTPGLLKYHKHLKMKFDPENRLNPNRMYSDL